MFNTKRNHYAQQEIRRREEKNPCGDSYKIQNIHKGLHFLYNVNEEVRRVKEDELVTFKADFTTFSHFA